MLVGGRRQVTRPCLRNICWSLDYVYSIHRPRKVIETLGVHCLKMLLKLHLTKIQRVYPSMHRDQGIRHWQGPGTMPWKRLQDKAWIYQIRIDRYRRTDSGEASHRKRKERWRPRNRAGFGRKEEIFESCFLTASFPAMEHRPSMEASASRRWIKADLPASLLSLR